MNFLPYIQLYEFEALLLADPQQFDWLFVEHTAQISKLVEIVSHYSTPEEIDDGPKTAPSKRIIQVLPEYKGQKASAGPINCSQNWP